MTTDPIIDDVRRTRDGLARRADYKINRIFADFRQAELRPDPEHHLIAKADLSPRPPVVRENTGTR